jgi:hypothetical protein
MMQKTALTDAMWAAFRAATGIPQDTYDVVAFARGSGKETELAELVLAGRKRATVNLMRNYLAGEPLPIIGGYVVTIDGEGNPRCIWRTMELRVHSIRWMTSLLMTRAKVIVPANGGWRHIGANMQRKPRRKIWRLMIRWKRCSSDSLWFGCQNYQIGHWLACDVRCSFAAPGRESPPARAAEGSARAETDLLARKVNAAAEADAQRKGRGRWARLRAAWRGR